MQMQLSVFDPMDMYICSCLQLQQPQIHLILSSCDSHIANQACLLKKVDSILIL